MNKPKSSSAEARRRVAERIAMARTGWQEGATLAGIRAGFESLLAGPVPTEVQPCEIAGMPAARCAPEAAIAGAVVLFCHGGGFQIGSLRSHRSLMSRLAASSQVTVLGFEYRLAPEHRFPAAVEDSFAAYCALLAEGISPARIIVAGDSAGGSLALGVALQAQQHGLPLPAGVVLLSPWLDLALRGDSYLSRADVDVFSKMDQLRAMARTYLGRYGDPAHPLATPIDAALGGLPPILIHAGDSDITLDDAVVLSKRAQSAGVACTLRIWPDMYHHFQVFAELPEAQQSLDDIGRFIRAQVG